MICKLCKTQEADKKNTHYLTDSIIRGALNFDGSNEREKGFYFDMSNNTPFIEYNFQRNTPVDKVEERLGRNITDEEIEKAKTIPYSVDNVFCSSCEKHFTGIEEDFITKILPKFREANLTDFNEIVLEDVKTIRLFFYLQVWRTAVCCDSFKITEICNETLRNIILNYKSLNIDDINHYPLSITYLQTLGRKEAYTGNFVGYTNDSNPNLIMMNDFIIQFYEKSVDGTTFFDFCNLNNRENYKKYINYKENKFIFNIFSDRKRLQFLENFYIKYKGIPLISEMEEIFILLYEKIYKKKPSKELLDKFIKEITSIKDFNALQYSKETIIKKTQEFFTRIENK
ncbi:hypothetical protein [Capnocytophaga cynodegmi]|uniref:Uncharacterized protein n=1 Tax=Capnocytophaga cynodegmi TaxID=28189 RepID=A0A0B7H6H5_9FLAO|nr:hypothetical protein [Capnocytophaga cynodegmi]CEN33542.1 hypothetical protein CCYN2B_170040 [Capnocytophaga cynodegmi]